MYGDNNNKNHHPKQQQQQHSFNKRPTSSSSRPQWSIRENVVNNPPRRRPPFTSYTNEMYNNQHNQQEQYSNIGQNKGQTKPHDPDIFDTKTFKKNASTYDICSRNNALRTIALAGFLILLLLLGVAAIVWSTQQNSFQLINSAIPGPPGPPGVTNITEANETIAGGNLTVLGDLTVEGMFHFDDNAWLSANGTCLDIDAPSVCLKRLNITDEVIGGDLCLDGDITVKGVLDLLSNLTMGNVTFYINETSGDVIVEGNIFFDVGLLPPVKIGEAGILDDLGGGVLLIRGFNQIKLDGEVMFNSSIVGNTTFEDKALFENGIIFNTNMPLESQLTIINTILTLYSENAVSIASNTSIWLEAPLTTVHGNLTIEGHTIFIDSVISDITIDDENQIIFSSGTGGSIGMVDNCLTISGDNVCIGGGELTLNGTGPIHIIDENIIFEGTSTVNSSMTITGDSTIVGNVDIGCDLTVGKDLIVLGEFTFTNINVTGNATFGGTIFSNNSIGNFISDLEVDTLKVNAIFRSQNIAFFEGQGAVFGTNTTLQVNEKFTVNSVNSEVRCANPVFRPDTLDSPNSFPCIPECPDMTRCDHRMNSLDVVTEFSVGQSLNDTIKGEVTVGTVNNLAIRMRVYSSDFLVNSTTTRFVGDILDENSDLHPCCTGESVPPSARTLVVAASSAIIIAVSESTVIPFNTILTPGSNLVPSYSVGTSIWTCPKDGTYTFTVYLDWLPAAFASGTFRGVTVRRDFSIPVAVGVPIRTCAESIVQTVPGFTVITCTYTSFFTTGNTARIHAYFDFAPSTTILGGAVGVSATRTRWEIFQHL